MPVALAYQVEYQVDALAIEILLDDLGEVFFVVVDRDIGS